MNSNVSTMAMVRQLVHKYTLEDLGQCMNEQISKASNACVNNGSRDDMLNALAKAGFVKQLMAQEWLLNQAMRELGRRMRALSGESS
jgi:hypothetical protein